MRGLQVVDSFRPASGQWTYARFKAIKPDPSGLQREFIARLEPSNDIFASGIQIYVVPNTAMPGEWVCSWQPIVPGSSPPQLKPESVALDELWAVIRGGVPPAGFGKLDRIG